MRGEKVDLAKSEFPQDAEEPQVLEFNMATMPVMTVSLSGKVPNRTLIYHAKELQNQIERIPGILEAPIVGDKEELNRISKNLDSIQLTANYPHVKGITRHRLEKLELVLKEIAKNLRK